MRALIYCRVSLDKAHGRSVAEQEAESRHICEREGWQVVEVVRDSVGASRHSKARRSGWERVHQALEAGEMDVLVTWEASRAQRDLAAYSELRDLCARHKVLWSYSGRLHDLNDSRDRFTTGLDALMAEREADEIASRIRRAVRANAAAGRPHGRLLFGYARVYDESTGLLDKQIPHPEQAPVVRRMFEQYLSGIGVNTIARRLTDDGITTGTGSEWTFRQVARVLRNPGYAGRRVHQGEVVGPANWPPLIEPQRFDEVQAILASRRGVRSMPTARLLTGVARCGVCHGRMGVNWDRKERRIYACLTKHCVARDLRKLDDYVTQMVLDRMAPAVTDADILGDPTDNREASDLRAQIAALEQRWADLDAAASAGELSVKMLVRQEQTINADLARLRDQLRRFTVPRHIELPTGDVGEWWGALGPAERRQVMAHVIDVLVIHRTGRGRRTLDPDAVEIVWR